MIPVSNGFLTALKQSYIDDKIEGEIVLSSGTIEIDDTNIYDGTLYINRSGVTSDGIEIGTANVGEFGADLNIEIDPAEVIGGKITLTYYLLVDGNYEPCPLGVFWIDEATRREGGGLTITAYDRMANFDIPITPMADGTALSWINNLCTQAGVLLETPPLDITAMANASETLIYPENSEIETCRDMLMWICQHLGAISQITANDTLKIISVESNTAVDAITERQLYPQTKTAENTIQITGVSYDDVLVGTNAIVLQLENNPLWASKTELEIETYLSNLLAQVGTLIYTPAELSYTSNPALEIGDILNRKVTTEETVGHFITALNWRHRASQSVSSAGMNIANKKRYSQTQKKISAVEAITNFTKEIAEAAKNTSDEINNAIGGNVLIRQEVGGTNEILIMDNANPAEAVKIWRWNMGGLGYSDNVIGADNPERVYSVAITMSGAISANFITTGILKAILIEAVEINCNDKFTVQPDGTMTATSGTIGGWDISDGGLFLPTEDGIEPVEVWNDNNQIVTVYIPPESDGKIASFFDDVAARHCQTFETTPFKPYKIQNSERALLTSEKIQDIEPDGQGNKNVYDGEWLEPAPLGIYNIIKTKYKYVTFIDDNILFLEPIEAGTKTAVGMWNETADYKGYSQIAKDVVSGIQYLSPSGVSSIVFHAGFEPDKNDPEDSQNSFYITQTGLAHAPSMLVKDTLFVKNYPQGKTAPQVIIENGKIKAVDGISQITISDDEIQAQQGINALGKIVFMENETRIENKAVTIVEKLIADAGVEFWSLPTIYDPAQGRPNNPITVYGLYIDGNGKIYRDETPITNKATD